MKSKIFALLFTGFVIALLLLSGPVQGFTLNMTVNKEKPKQGETVTFTTQVDIQQNERLPIDKLILELTGKEKIVCTFDRSGQPLGGCDNIKITKITDPGYGYGKDLNFGYGYGFATGQLKYKIEIKTKNLRAGDYLAVFKIKINDEIHTHNGVEITVRDDDKNEKICTKEWTCTQWSSCSAGMQYRECFQNLNACESEEMPQQERLCLLEDGTNFFAQEIENEKIASETRQSEFVNNGLSDGIQFIIILLLLNCIITTLDIIVRVQQRFTLLSKKRFKKKTSSIKK